MASCVGNICTKNYQNLTIGFQVTVENCKNIENVFGTQCNLRTCSGRFWFIYGGKHLIIMGLFVVHLQ